MQKYHFDEVENFAGFSKENAEGGQKIKLLVRAPLTSDDNEFYDYIDRLSSTFLSKHRIQLDHVYQFLVLIHDDLSADLYINNIMTEVEMISKRNLINRIMTVDNIADIRQLKFPHIKIKPSDKVFYCFKVDWKFGLYFDTNLNKNLNIDELYISLGKLYCRLKFDHVFKVIQSSELYDDMKQDGWFPFIEIVGSDYKELTDVYKNKSFHFEERISSWLDRFDEKRVRVLISKWWIKEVFKEKQQILEAGVESYISGGQAGYINCIKTLVGEIEGILRIKYLNETGKGKHVGNEELFGFLLNSANNRTKGGLSLLLPAEFINYLKDILFANFNLETGDLALSRNSSLHGVAKQEDYDREKALQIILALDQIFFYFV